MMHLKRIVAMTVEIFSSQLLFMHFVCMHVCSDVCHLLKNSEFKNFASELITHLIRLRCRIVSIFEKLQVAYVINVK